MVTMPGFRIGWVAAGKHARKIQRLQLMSTLSTSSPMQLVLKPGRDLRDSFDAPVLRQDVLDIKDLHIGQKLEGVVRNVVDFGAFVDIGIHEDGLIHISHMSKQFIKHPSQVVSVGDYIHL